MNRRIVFSPCPIRGSVTPAKAFRPNIENKAVKRIAHDISFVLSHIDGNARNELFGFNIPVYSEIGVFLGKNSFAPYCEILERRGGGSRLRADGFVESKGFKPKWTQHLLYFQHVK